MREGRLNLLKSLMAVLDLNDRDETSYALARYFLEHFDGLADLNIYDVMDECYASRSGVRRFCQSIGYDNFSEIKACASEWDLFRHYYLTYPRSEQEGQHDLRRDLSLLYQSIDRLVAAGAFDTLVDTLHACDQAVLFSAGPSAVQLSEVQSAMVTQHKLVQLVTESSPASGVIRALGPNDVLIAASTSGAFVERQVAQIRDSGAYKVYVTANDREDLASLFDEVILIGEGVTDDAAVHRVFATYGICYTFDRLFSAYSGKYDHEPLPQEGRKTCSASG